MHTIVTFSRKLSDFDRNVAKRIRKVHKCVTSFR